MTSPILLDEKGRPCMVERVHIISIGREVVRGVLGSVSGGRKRR